jgi:hypothetical protein
VVEAGMNLAVVRVSTVLMDAEITQRMGKRAKARATQATTWRHPSSRT